MGFVREWREFGEGYKFEEARSGQLEALPAKEPLKHLPVPTLEPSDCHLWSVVRVEVECQCVRGVHSAGELDKAIPKQIRLSN
jgi:hypothetical protein